MAEYYFLPKKLVRRFPRLEKAAQQLEALVLKGLLSSMQALPPTYCAALLGGLFKTFGPYTDKARKADINLQTAFPAFSEDRRQQTVRQIFKHLGHAAAELISAPKVWERRDQLIDFVAHPDVQAVIDSKEPTIFVTAHVGAWQYTNFIAAHYGFNITIVYAREANPVTHDMFYKLRSGLLVRLLPSSGSIRSLLKELKRGNSIGLAIDTRPDSGDLLPFFGRKAITNTVAARLALRTGHPLVPVRAERLPNGRFRITTCAPITAAEPDTSKEEQALEMSLQLNQLFEQWISETPGEWVCLKRRWPKAHKL